MAHSHLDPHLHRHQALGCSGTIFSITIDAVPAEPGICSAHVCYMYTYGCESITITRLDA